MCVAVRPRAALACFFALICAAGSARAAATSAPVPKRPFTVADEIGLTLFGDPNGGEPELHFSPDGRYFALWSQRGLLESNRVEESLRFYRSQDVRNFVEGPARSVPPAPDWVVSRTDTEGRIIGDDWQWLADSSGVAFTQHSADGTESLVLADLRSRTVAALTVPSARIKAFAIHDRNHFAYTGVGPAELEQRQRELDVERHAPAIVGAEKPLRDLLFPELTKRFPPTYLWAVLDGQRLQVKSDGLPIAPDRELSLSPDGQKVVTRLKVANIPASWQRLFPPPYPSDRSRLQPGKTNVFQFAVIDLPDGNIRSLTDAPISGDAGDWAWVDGLIQWSNDGQAVLLPGTYLRSKDDSPSRPCVAVVDLASNTRSCVEMLKGHTESGREEGYRPLGDVRFINGQRDHVAITFLDLEAHCAGVTEYTQGKDTTWQVTGRPECRPEAAHDGLEITVKQSFNEPPRLVATAGRKSRVVWDPNPQLQDFNLGEATIYKWRDKDGHEWQDGLYKPPGYQHGKRYPLVIQTHGFNRFQFRPSGVFPTAYAAMALAAQGIMVAQVAYHCPNIATPEEGPCMASAFQSIAKQLVADGLVDPDRIGVVGFSRSCYHVMEALTTDSLHFGAASITDGVMETYLQFILDPERSSEEDNSMIGAPPFGQGLQLWLQRSPGFNLEKVNAPLMVVGEGPLSLLGMWEPYAGLHYLKKPVDLIMLNTDEHVLTNPAERLASQGGSVDWFRFWLQGYEDPDSAKAEQYRRWERLCDVQVGQNSNRPAFCVRSKAH